MNGLKEIAALAVVLILIDRTSDDHIVVERRRRRCEVDASLRLVHRWADRGQRPLARHDAELHGIANGVPLAVARASGDHATPTHDESGGHVSYAAHDRRVRRLLERRAITLASAIAARPTAASHRGSLAAPESAAAHAPGGGVTP
jgi:hypothetical protein